MLHPCQTAARMLLLLSSCCACEFETEVQEQADWHLTYALAWFSLVAPLLSLPLRVPLRGDAAHVTLS